MLTLHKGAQTEEISTYVIGLQIYQAYNISLQKITMEFVLKNL